MHSSLASLAVLAAGVSAFPAMSHLDARQTVPVEGNGGFIPNLVFNAQDQFVNVAKGSANQFVAPISSDIRGPCPGLNAAANHNFISHTGVIDLQDTTIGLATAYNFGIDFAAPLFFLAVLNSGSLIDQKWSIGGPMPTISLGGLLGQGLGISNSHNKYEGDASPGRGDAFLHGGDSHSLNLFNYADMLAWFNSDGVIDFDGMHNHALQTHEFSKNNNPYAFFGPLFAVPPIAHHFILAMMSNHSADNVGGYVDMNIINSFFSVSTNKAGALVWNPGHETIPQNWYRRPSSNPYGIPGSFGDFGLLIAKYPEMAEIGGNTGTVGSFVGVDVSDLTGGVFNAQSLLQGNNLACFFLEASVFAVPGASAKILGALTPFLSQANKVLSAAKLNLGCPQLTSVDMSQFNQFPGFTTSQPLQPATPY